jgi:hypothetical protein
MKMKSVLMLIAFAILTTITFAQTVDEIIDKHLAAMGGKENIAKLKTLKITSNIEVAPNMKAPMTMIIVNNKAFRMDLQMQGMTMTQAVYGDSGWAIIPWSGKKEAERMNSEEIQDSKDQMDIAGALYNYKEKGHKVELLGKEDMEGTEVYKLKLTKKNGNIEYDYLDADSYLTLKETTTHKYKDKEVTGDVIYSDYRKVDGGIMFPFGIEQREAGSSQGQPLNADKVEINVPVDESIFKMPPPAAPAPEVK